MLHFSFMRFALFSIIWCDIFLVACERHDRRLNIASRPRRKHNPQGDNNLKSAVPLRRIPTAGMKHGRKQITLKIEWAILN